MFFLGWGWGWVSTPKNPHWWPFGSAKGTKVKAKAPQTEKATAGEVAMPNWVIFKEAQTSKHFGERQRLELLEGGAFQSSHTIHGIGIFTDPWMVDFYGKFVGKYTVRPMDGMGFGSFFSFLSGVVELFWFWFWLILKGVLVEGCIWNMKIDDICGIKKYTI